MLVVFKPSSDVVKERRILLVVLNLDPFPERIISLKNLISPDKWSKLVISSEHSKLIKYETDTLSCRNTPVDYRNITCHFVH